MDDAVVIGAGPNGLVAANLLADAGWSVCVVEAAESPGGAVKSAEVTAPGFRTDLFSAFYPLAVASPWIRALQLESYGLRWLHAPTVLAHPLAAAGSAVLHRDPEQTAAALDADAPGDGEQWLRLLAAFERVREPLLDVVLGSWMSPRRLLTLLRRAGVATSIRAGRDAVTPVRRWTQECFHGSAAPVLFAGNALHTDLGPDSAGGLAFGWLLSMLAQTVGFPVPEGGAHRLTDALTGRLRDRGGRILSGAPVTQLLVLANRCHGVVVGDGSVLPARHAVLAAVDAPQLFSTLLAEHDCPPPMRARLRRFQWDNTTVKVDWALSAPIPWSAGSATGAGTVHVGGDLDALGVYSAQLAAGHVPAHPFVVLGQMTTADPSRSPAGTESAWAYTHVPQQVRGDAGEDGMTGRWDAADVNTVVDRVEAAVERYAPGFRDLVIARHVQGPRELQAANRSLHAGALNGGTAALHQQLLWRPLPGVLGPYTPVDRLFLASSSAHPGGGVHGAPGGIAARAALRSAGVTGPAQRQLSRALRRLVR